ncbi:hypothetical protein WMY93_006633 [Mugilogobius chulae]|uniref:Uncharacterized protein n=1 Tax=Mugilogobius chulae TaxID=88201 RepID=A0AAW0PRR1_9GOBI
MPSRTIGRNKGAILSQYYNRTMELRDGDRPDPPSGTSPDRPVPASEATESSRPV